MENSRIKDLTNSKDYNLYFKLAAKYDESKTWLLVSDYDINKTPLNYFDEFKNFYELYGLFYYSFPVGFLTVKKFDKDLSTEISIIIKKNYRKKGFGKYFLNYILKYLKKRGASKVVVYILPTNTSSISLFLSEGFKYSRQDDEYYYYEYKMKKIEKRKYFKI